MRWKTHYTAAEYWAAPRTGECQLCGKQCFRRDSTDYYMVHDDVWVDEAGLPPAVMTYVVTGRPVSVECFLCLGCLEKRLGRKVTLDDLTDAPVNNALRATLRAQEAA